MTKERELLRRALELLERDDDEQIEFCCIRDDIRAYLAVEEGKQEEEPVYLFRRKGLNDFVTCSKERFDELSEIHLFETKILHPSRIQNKETATRSEDVVTEATDQEPVAWRRYNPLQSCWEYDKYPEDLLEDERLIADPEPLFLHPSPQAEQRKPLSEEEIDQELWGSTHYSRSFTAGVRWAEKMHRIGGGDDV